MKIIYLTDIHDGLDGLKRIFLNTRPDLYLLSGDIIYKAFYNFDRIIEFCTYQEELDILAKDNGDDMTPFDFATRVIRFPEKFPESLQHKSTMYRHLFNSAAKTMKEKYQIIDRLVKKYARSECFFLPGNYDIDLQYTALYERDLHRKTLDFSGYRFAGYGGAPIVTSGIPEKLSVKFHEYNRNGFEYSEPEDFFREQLPDIAVIHNPSYGYLDKIPGFGHVGSQGIRRFIDDNPPLLCVSGHVHEDQGVIKKGNTVFFNPSNFGPVDSIYGFQAGGFFGEIEIEKSGVKNVGLFRLQGKDIYHLMQVDASGDKLSAEYVNPESPISVEEFIR
jgi:Icc-related predicted phosphoesterase